MKTDDPQSQSSPNFQEKEDDRFWAWLSNGLLVRFLLFFASGWALVQLLSYFELLVVIFVTSTILAFLLNHPVAWLTRWMPRGVAAVGLFVSCLMILGGLSITLGMTVLSQGQALAASVQEFSDSLNPLLASLDALLQDFNLQINLQDLEPQLQDQALGLVTGALGLIQATLANFVLGILIAVVTLFMLLDGAQIWWWLLNHLPIRNKQRFNEVIQKNLLGFFWGRLVLSIFFGISAFLVFLLLQVPFPIVLAIIVGVFDLIPGVGATLGIGLVCILLLSQSVWLSIQVLVSCVALQQVEENVLLPHIMKDSLDINPVVMFFALIVGATVAGVLGMFLAVPVAGVIVTWLNIEAMRGQSAKATSRSLPSDSINR